MKALKPRSAPASRRTKDQREKEEEERKEAKGMKRVWSSRREVVERSKRGGKKGFASGEGGQRPRVKALQTRKRLPPGTTMRCVCRYEGVVQ